METLKIFPVTKKVEKMSHSAEKNWKCLTLDPYYVFQDVRLFFFRFAQGFEISSVLNLRVLNLPQVVEKMN